MFEKLPIKDQHEIIRNSNLSRDDKVFSHNYITQKIQKPQVEKEVKEFWLNLKQKGIVAWFSFIFLLIVAGLLLNQTEAKEQGICNSDKCEARYTRIVTCKKFSKNKNDVVQCALWKTVFSRKDEVDRHEKEEIKEELKNLMDKIEGNNTVFHNSWDISDEKQSTLQKIYNEGVKQGMTLDNKNTKENLKDMLGTFLGENGNLNMSLRSYKIGSNGHYDYGLCQINKGYHPKIVKDDRFFKDIDFQIENCVRLYRGGTKFYGAKHKEKMKKHLIFN